MTHKISFRKSVLAGVLACGLTVWPMAYGDDAPSSDGMTFLMETGFLTANPETLKWEKNKSVPYGMVTIMLYGDPKQPGPYTFRAKMASGYKLPPHRHPDDRTVTLIKGIYWTGTGEKYNPMKMKELQAGAFYVTKAGTPHYAWARTEVIIQESGIGPETGIEYVNPQDDPRTAN